jgi:CheY-like chemotaxis protein
MNHHEQEYTPSILVVEDNFVDFESIRRAFQKLDVQNPVYHCETGEKALDFLYGRGEFSDRISKPRPSVIILDLNLPGTDGRDVLREIKSNGNLKSIPVVVLTTSRAGRDIRECYLQGANNYIMKPSDWEAFFAAIDSFRSFYLKTITLPDCKL